MLIIEKMIEIMDKESGKLVEKCSRYGGYKNMQKQDLAGQKVPSMSRED